MIYRIGTADEFQHFKADLPADVKAEILHCVSVLDNSYGNYRNYYEVGGYCIFAETTSDLSEIKNSLDYENLLYEWENPVGSFKSRLYLLGDDYSVVLIAPEF